MGPPSLQDLSISGFLDRIAAVRPTLPAGGSAAALLGALAAALGAFVSQVSADKSDSSAEKTELFRIARRMGQLQQCCLQIMETDPSHCQKVFDALALSEASAEAKAKKADALDRAYQHALAPPLALVEASLEMLQLSRTLLKNGYDPAWADIGAVVEIAHAGLQAGAQIAQSNLCAMADSPFQGDCQRQLEDRQAQGEQIYRDIRL